MWLIEANLNMLRALLTNINICEKYAIFICTHYLLFDGLYKNEAGLGFEPTTFGLGYQRSPN